MRNGYSVIDVAVILNPGSGTAGDEDAQRKEILDQFASHGRVATIFVENAPGVYRGRDVTLVVVDFGARR